MLSDTAWFLEQNNGATEKIIWKMLSVPYQISLMPDGEIEVNNLLMLVLVDGTQSTGWKFYPEELW